ncbi:MAG: alpha/beta hydrolase family protein [Burkholderiaceae bacterium]
MKTKLLCVLFMLLSLAQMAWARVDPRLAPACLMGVYRSPQGETLSLVPVPGHPDWLRANELDGRLGTFKKETDDTLIAAPNADDPTELAGKVSNATCGHDSISLQLGRGAKQRWARLPLRITRTRFKSGTIELNGELIEPTSALGKPPLVVHVHGSESTAAVDSSTMPYLMAIAGIASFVFDKRGTGASSGTYTQDFELLSDDVAAAVRTARRLAGDRVGRVGVAGFSQGGWVAPAAATKAPVDFVVVGYGVVGTAMEQDEWQVAYQLRDAGFTDADIAKARELTDLAGRVAASNFNDGLAALRAAVKRREDEPWLAKVDGQYTGELIRGEIDRARSESPGVLWHYDTRQVLDRLNVPQLWVFAQDDSVAPSAPSIARLKEFQRAGKSIAIAVFPKTDHGIRTYTVKPDGTRKSLHYASGYDQLLADWIEGKPLSRYGDATLQR